MVLDAEGAERSVVETFPFDKIPVDIIQLKFARQDVHWDRDLVTKRRQEFSNVMKRRLPLYKEKAVTFLDVFYAKE